jgi:hypothetical protein
VRRCGTEGRKRVGAMEVPVARLVGMTVIHFMLYVWRWDRNQLMGFARDIPPGSELFCFHDLPMMA